SSPSASSTPVARSVQMAAVRELMRGVRWTYPSSRPAASSMAESGTSSATSAAGLSSWDMRPSMAWAAWAATLGSMVRYRHGTPDDTRICFEIFETAVDDLGPRPGGNGTARGGD